MNGYFIAAAVIAIAIGVLHSWLGERYILIRLFRRTDLPHLFGSDSFTRRTLRFAWHITTIFLFGLAALLLQFSRAVSVGGSVRSAVKIIGWTFLLSSVIALIGSRGRHFSWLLFLGSAVLVWLGLRG